MEFQKLELEPDKSWIQKTISSPHTKRTLFVMLLGGIVSFAFFYFSEGQHMESLAFTDILKSSGIGAAFGLFITNSPCARGRC